MTNELPAQTMARTEAAYPTTNGTAVMALVMTLVPLPVAGPIVAICLARSARKEIRRTGQTGDAMAVAALWLGFIELAWLLAVLLAFLLFTSAIVNVLTHRTTSSLPTSVAPTSYTSTSPATTLSPAPASTSTGSFSYQQGAADAASRGWTCFDGAGYQDWDQFANVKALACKRTGVNTGHMRVLFYGDNGFMGYDTSDDSADVRLTGRNGDTIDVTYTTWNDPNAPMVSPTGHNTVPYKWEGGNKMTPQAPIPPVSQRR